LAATGPGSRQVVDFDDQAGRFEVEVGSRVVIEGVNDPRLWLVATSATGGDRCVLGLNPPNATTGKAGKWQMRTLQDTVRGLRQRSDLNAAMTR
jgi:hypothetical protein